MDDRWMTLRQAASYTGFAVDHLSDLAARREVPHEVRENGTLRFRASRLDAWMDGKQTQSGTRDDEG